MIGSWAVSVLIAVGVPTTVTGPYDSGLAEDPCHPPAPPVAPRARAPFEADTASVTLLDSQVDRSDPLSALVPADAGPIVLRDAVVPLSELPDGAPHEVVAASLARIDGIRRLNLGRSGLRDLQPLAHLRNVEQLDLYDTAISDLSPLSAMVTLEALDLRTTPIADLSPLASLPILRRLAVDETAVRKLAPLAKMGCLEKLGIRDTKVVSLRPLVKLPRLRELHLDGSAVASLAPLARVRGLEVLSASHTAIHNLQPLARLTSLRVVSIASTQVTDLRPLYGLPQLDVVDVRRIPIDVEDVEALQEALPFTAIYTTVYEEDERRRRELEIQRDLGRARFELARALWRRGHRLEEARELAEQALDAFRNAGDDAEADRVGVRDWLRLHPI